MRYIYAIQNQLNLKIYVGQTKDVKERWRKHRGKFARNHGHLYDAMTKYGRENFTFTVIEEVEDADADSAESFWIMFFRSWDPEIGYNKTTGGKATHSLTDETKKKISEAVKRNRKPYHHSDETKQRLREIGTGRKASTETRAKMSSSHLGWSPSTETRKKMGVAKSGPTPWKRGDGNPNAKITEEIAREIRQMYDDGQRICDIAIALGVRSNIVYSVAKRLTWKHLDA